MCICINCALRNNSKKQKAQFKFREIQNSQSHKNIKIYFENNLTQTSYFPPNIYIYKRKLKNKLYINKPELISETVKTIWDANISSIAEQLLEQ